MDYLTDFVETAGDMITNAKDAIVDYFTCDTYTTRKKILTTCTLCTLTGILIGFLLSPIKKGFYLNISNNGNYIPPEEEE